MIKSVRYGIFYILAPVSILIFLVTLLSLLYNVQYWYIKVLDFPRLQMFIAGLICFFLLLVMKSKWKKLKNFLIVILIISISIQLYFLFPYTSLAEKEVKTLKEDEVSQKHLFSLMVANVWMKNSNANGFLDIVLKNQPDILLVMETNQWWINQLKVLNHHYSYSMTYPLDNTYGMALYSKLPLKNQEILFLSHDSVPSFHTNVNLYNGKTFNFHGVHPVPPKPSEYPDNLGEEEVALLKIGKMVASENFPSIVAGDFNDVAWSKTSRLFKEQGKLNNVRIGRGLFNTFNAKSQLLRWPLDHVFVTEEFKLSKISRLPEFGSDHFPILVELSLKSKEQDN